MNSSKTIGVLGAGGVQGGAVARQLLRDGFHVIAIGRRLEPLRETFGEQCEARTADVFDPASLAKAFAGCDAAFCVMPLASGVREAKIIEAARSIRDGLQRADVKRSVWTMSWLCGDGSTSLQFDSLAEAERIALASTPQAVTLRPAGYLDSVSISCGINSPIRNDQA